MAKLVLEDGREFIGKSFGDVSQFRVGEIVFNTSMTGYQEILTDPSYAGQIVTLTYPEIGNYGCNQEDYESVRPFAQGLVIKNYSPIISNWRASESLDGFLKRYNIPAIHGIDTRALTRHIRDKGAMRAAIIPDLENDTKNDKKDALQAILAAEKMEGADLASTVTCSQKYNVGENGKYKVIALDFGIKKNIVNRLVHYGCNVEVIPAYASPEYILSANADGIFLSNGPGDPAAVEYAIATIKQLIKNFHKPIFGICLGHQILALATGAKSYKLKFGHRGANQPIKNLQTGKIEIASHNHGFAISKENLPDNLEITHLNINDDTIAGLRFRDRPNVFSVQYHPEASPGPRDSDYLFKDFVELMSCC